MRNSASVVKLHNHRHPVFYGAVFRTYDVDFGFNYYGWTTGTPLWALTRQWLPQSTSANWSAKSADQAAWPVPEADSPSPLCVGADRRLEP